MNTIAVALQDLYEAEESLADLYVKLGERMAAEHEVWHMCKRFAEQCHLHAATVREHAVRYGEQLPPPDDSEVGETATAPLRKRLSALLGRAPQSGLLLVHVLRELYLGAQDVSFHWLLAGQIAQAARDWDLLAACDELHRETLTQIKWVKSQAKEGAPQALVAGTQPWIRNYEL